MSDSEENVITNFNFYTDATFQWEWINERRGIKRAIKVSIGQVLVQTSDEKGDHIVRPNVFDVTDKPRDVGCLSVSLALFNESWTAELFGIYLAIYKVFTNDKLRANRFAVYTICSDCQPSIFAAQCLAVECQRRFENHIPSTGPIADNFLYLFGVYKNSKASNYHIMTKDANFVTVLRALEMLYNAILNTNEKENRHGFDFSFAYVPAHYEDEEKRARTPIYDLNFSKCNILVKETALDLFYLMYADEIADIKPDNERVTKVPKTIYPFMRQGVNNIMEKKLESLHFVRITLNLITEAMLNLDNENYKKDDDEMDDDGKAIDKWVNVKKVLTGVARDKGDATITVCDIEKKISTVLERWKFADIPVRRLNDATMLDILDELVAQEKDYTRTISQISKRTKGVVRRRGGRKNIRQIPVRAVKSLKERLRPYYGHRKLKIVAIRPHKKITVTAKNSFKVCKITSGNSTMTVIDDIFYDESIDGTIEEITRDEKHIMVEDYSEEAEKYTVIKRVPEPISHVDTAREQNADVELEDIEDSKDFESYMINFINSVKSEVEASNEWWNKIFGSGGAFDSDKVLNKTSINTLMGVSFMRFITPPTL